MPNPKVSIFWDNSNIYISAQEVAARKEGAIAAKEIRIHFQNLFKLAKAGRDVQSGILVGSVPPELEEVWQHAEETGLEIELYERGEISGSEQGTDQCLQVHMLRALVDHPPGVAVLLTGDGAGYDTGAGFHADLERMYKRGWGIEVISWDFACNKGLKSWAQSVGVYIELERFYNSVTFREGSRFAKQVGLTHRQYAKLSNKTP
jgi:hypothetical protein